MDSINFIKEKLYYLYELFPYLEIQYEYNYKINTHVIEVKPIHCFNSDKKYADFQIDFEAEFEENFPYEDILFMTENILIQISDPILKLGSSNNILVYEDVSAEFSLELDKQNFLDYIACEPLDSDLLAYNFEFEDENVNSPNISFIEKIKFKKIKKILKKYKNKKGSEQELFLINQI